jgi:microcystin-dependent protein
VRTLYTCFVLLFFFSLPGFSQDLPSGFSYQAVIRDAAGFPKKGATVSLEFSLLPGQFSDSPTWVETHQVRTDSLGICNVVIGDGKRTGGTADSFTKVNFGEAGYWLQVRIQDGSTWALLSKQQLLSVPYARVASRVVNEVPPVPIGTILPFAGSVDKIPDGWDLCDGQAKSINDAKYKALFSILGYNWGRGENQMDFRLPDLRGQFLRGVSKDRDGKESDSDPNRSDARYAKYSGNVGNEVGSYQDDEFKSHNHDINDPGHAHDYIDHAQPARNEFDSGGNRGLGDHGKRTSTSHTGITIQNKGGAESRPKNAYVYYIIKL